MVRVTQVGIKKYGKDLGFEFISPSSEQNQISYKIKWRYSIGVPNH